MSSWVTPVIIWPATRAPETGDFERIEGNTDYLKDRVDATDTSLASSDVNIATNTANIATNTADIASNTSSIASNSSRVTTLEGSGSIQGVGTTNSPTFGGVTLTGTLLPKTSPSSGSWVVTGGLPYVIPRGIYQVALSGAADLEIYVSGGWRDSNDGCVISDGVKVRIAVSSGTATSYYLKF